MYKGKTNTRTVKADSYKKAEKMLNEFIYEIEHSLNEKTQTTYFSDFTEVWYTKYVEKNLTDKTQKFYKYLLIRINEYFNGYEITEIKRIDIINFLDSLTSDYVKNTIDKYRKCLINIFNYAIKCEVINNNPATLVTTPNGKDYVKKENVYTPEQMQQLIKTLDNTDDKKYVVLFALLCGLRRQEILAINKEDIDFNNNTVTINKAMIYDDKEGFKVGKTKTVGSNRTVYVPSNILEALKEFPEGKLFNYTPDYITKWFHKFITANNLPHLTFHGLRHTNATYLISNGTDYKTVSSILGHSQTSTTMNIYVHKNEDNIIKAGKLFENLG